MYNSQVVIRSFFSRIQRKRICDEAKPMVDRIIYKNSGFYQNCVPLPCPIPPIKTPMRSSSPTAKFSKYIIERFVSSADAMAQLPSLRLFWDDQNLELQSIFSKILASRNFSVLCIFHTGNAKDFEHSFQFLYLYQLKKKYHIGYLDSTSDMQLSALLYRLFPKKLRALPEAVALLRNLLLFNVQMRYGVVPTFIPIAEEHTPTLLPLLAVHLWKDWTESKSENEPDNKSDKVLSINLSLKSDFSEFPWGYFYIHPFMADFSSYRTHFALDKFFSNDPTKLLLHTAALFCLYYQSPVCPYQNPTPNELDAFPSVLYILFGSGKDYSRIIMPLFRSFPLFQRIDVKRNQSVAAVLHGRNRFNGITVFYFHGLPRALTASECDRLLSFSKVTFLMNACTPKGYPHAIPLFLSCLNDQESYPVITKKQWSVIRCAVQENYNKEKIDCLPENCIDLLPAGNLETISGTAAPSVQTDFHDFLCWAPSISRKQLERLMSPRSIPDKWPSAFTYMVSAASILDKNDNVYSFFIANTVCREAVLTYYQSGTFFPVTLLCFHYFLSENFPCFSDSFEGYLSDKTLGWRKGQHLYLNYNAYYDKFTSWVHNRVNAASVYPYLLNPYLPKRQRDFERMILAPEDFIQYASKPKSSANGKTVQPPIVFRRKDCNGIFHQFLRLKKSILDKNSFAAVSAQIAHGIDSSNGILYFSDIS